MGRGGGVSLFKTTLPTLQPHDKKTKIRTIQSILNIAFVTIEAIYNCVDRGFCRFADLLALIYILGRVANLVRVEQRILSYYDLEFIEKRLSRHGKSQWYL